MWLLARCSGMEYILEVDKQCPDFAGQLDVSRFGRSLGGLFPEIGDSTAQVYDERHTR